MQRRIGRRSFLGGAFATGAWLASGPLKAAGAGEALASTVVATGVRLVTGAGANVVAIDGPAGLMLVDSGAARHAGALQRHVEASGTGPVRTVVNTHWHEEQTGGNAWFARSGAAIVAHEYTRQWMQRPVHLPWQGRTVPPAAAQALPTRTFRSTLALEGAGQAVQLGYLGQAHTDTDLYVHLPEANVLVAGDVVSTGRFPVLDYSTGGWIGGMIEALRTLVRLADGGTQVIAATGPAVDRAHLEAQLKMLETLRDRIWQLLRQGRTEAEILAARPAAEFEAGWGDPTAFITAACKGLWDHVRENRGVV